MLIVGFSIITLSVLIIPLIKNLYFDVGFGTFITRVGAATIETMNESYFFKIVNEENADEISFSATLPLFLTLSLLFSCSSTFHSPIFEYLYFILGAILLVDFSLACV